MKAFILAMLFSLLAVSALSTQPNDLHEMGVKGYELVLDMKFTQADRIFNEMIRIEPENALGHLLLALSCGRMWEANGSDEKIGEKYGDLLTRVRDIAEEMLAKNEEDIDALFYAGCTYGKLARHYMQTGKWIRAYINGRTGTAYMEKVLEKDPEYYDAYLGIGMSHYFIKTISEYSRVLSLIAGDTEGYREQGIDEILRAVSKGKYVSDEAKIILAIDIYLDLGFEDYTAALPLLKELTIKYPNNYFLKLHLAECYMNLNKSDSALQTIERLFLSEPLKENKYLVNRLYYILGRTYSKINEFEKAVTAFKKALGVPQTKALSLLYMGSAYEMMGEIEKAHNTYKKIEKNNGLLGDIYLSAKLSMENPLTPDMIHFYKGTNYLACEKYTQAAEIFYKLIEIELAKEKPNKAFIENLRFNIGRVEYELKEYEKAINIFLKVLASNDLNIDFVKPWCHYYLADIYRKAGEIEKAIKEYNIAYEFEGEELRSLIEEAREKMK